MEMIPAPYDGTNSQRSLTEAMLELAAFRRTRKAHDLSVLRWRDYGTVKEVEPGPIPLEPKKRKSKRPVESEE